MELGDDDVDERPASANVLDAGRPQARKTVGFLEEVVCGEDADVEELPVPLPLLFAGFASADAVSPVLFVSSPPPPAFCACF